jgi:hypothetical protein
MTTRWHGGSKAGWLPWICATVAAAFFASTILQFFPNSNGRLGYDYGLFLPWMIAGHFWYTVNGPFVPPEFVPSFCGGIPFLFNPQSVYWSLPQALMTVLPPLASLAVSWITFGVLGALGMFLLLRRTFSVSCPAALAGASIFLLNGFYIDRMIVGHVTFHGVMLLPWIAFLLFARSGGRRRLAPAARGIGAGLMLAYLFYSGGTNTILPMLLALAILALLLVHQGRWHRGIVWVTVLAFALFLALSAYKLVPALAFAGNVVRPVSLRMTGSLPALVGGAGLSLFVPQLLAYLPAETLVLDRVEFEYGVGITPLIAVVCGIVCAVRRRELAPLLKGSRALPLTACAVLLAVPILVNWDALGLRWLVLHVPVLKMMSVMLRFWFAYVPLLCVLTALLLDYVIHAPARRAICSSAAIALTIGQSALTDMDYYASQQYDPSALVAAHARIRAGGTVPPIGRIADPWAPSSTARQRRLTARNDAVVFGVSAYPCYEPMFGYRMEVFRPGRLATGPALEDRNGLLNLKNPSCYVYPRENQCRPGDEFTRRQRLQAEAFSHYRPFPYERPLRQTVAGWLSLFTFIGCLLALAAIAALTWKARRSPVPSRP